MRMPPKLSKREILLAKLASRPHRYRRARAVTMTVSMAILFAVPLLGIARFDAWAGRHYALFAPVGPVTGLAAIFGGMAALYFVTFLANFLFGRLFCGWGCPVGQISRFGEEMVLAARSRGGRRLASLKGGFFGLALAAAVLLWWVDPRVLVRGSARDVGITLGVFFGLALATYLHGRYWRWAFCKKICPIGLYYSVVHVQGPWGIHFHPEVETCKNCHACDFVCPVGLDPRDLARPQRDVGGLAFEDLPGDHHCLRCADCVVACEHVFRREPGTEIPLSFGGSPGRRATTRTAESDCGPADE